MSFLGSIGFVSPWLLAALVTLPVLWFLLRAVPPAPIRRMFPGVILLLGLRDDEQVTDKTPWWLLALRMLALGAVIVGLAGPVLNPEARDDRVGNGPLLVVLDGGWASAADWTARLNGATDILKRASLNQRPVAFLRLSDPAAPVYQTADAIVSRLRGLSPTAWRPDGADDVITMLPEGDFDTFWISDGVDFEGRDRLFGVFEDKGAVSIIQPENPAYTLRPGQYDDGILTITAERVAPGPEIELQLEAHGPDPSGTPTILLRAPLVFAQDALEASVDLNLPSELRARIKRFALEGYRSAGAVTLPDDALRRREVALVAGLEEREGLQLLSPLHFLSKTLEPSADLLNGALSDLLPANPDVIVLADVAQVGAVETVELLDWVERGGLLLRFAGPRLAASDISRDEEDPLLPVRLRDGGRTIGGAMSWGDPKTLAPFPEGSPFFGLEIPQDVFVSSQVVAQPDPGLAERAIASLEDGTPLATRKTIGQGQVVLFHVTANAEWSNLPLSGLFMQMLERLAVSSLMERPEAEELEGTVWQPQEILDGYGSLDRADTLPSVMGPNLVSKPLGPSLRPGLYAGQSRTLARNVVEQDTQITKATWPSGVNLRTFERPQELPLVGYLLALAIGLFLIDILASLFLSGRLNGKASGRVAPLIVVFMLFQGTPDHGMAQDSAQALEATSEVVLAHVLTGNKRVDGLAHAGLAGLGETVFFRTSVEPDPPHGVDLEHDELAFYPFLYWPIDPAQPTPSDAAYSKLNAYLRSGGMILFDTRDADVSRFGDNSANQRKLRDLAKPLDIPPLEPLPSDHVLTRTFYLLQEFPGRYRGREIWVEAAPASAEQVDGMPFRNLNDNVTPIVIGGNDWAAAWATDERGMPLVQIGRGFAGERQREIAHRFGVNLVMHVLTGNYKSDQVHVPALLERLGQ